MPIDYEIHHARDRRGALALMDYFRYGRRNERAFFLLLAILLFPQGCSGYASQAEQYRTQARSDLAAAVYVLERLGKQQVSRSFARVSLREYAKGIQATAQSFRSLAAPPAAEASRIRTVAVLSRAQSQMRAVGQEDIKRREASGLARRLRALAKELGP